MYNQGNQQNSNIYRSNYNQQGYQPQYQGYQQHNNSPMQNNNNNYYNNNNNNNNNNNWQGSNIFQNNQMNNNNQQNQQYNNNNNYQYNQNQNSYNNNNQYQYQNSNNNSSNNNSYYYRNNNNNYNQNNNNNTNQYYNQNQNNYDNRNQNQNYYNNSNNNQYSNNNNQNNYYNQNQNTPSWNNNSNNNNTQYNRTNDNSSYYNQNQNRNQNSNNNNNNYNNSSNIFNNNNNNQNIFNNNSNNYNNNNNNIQNNSTTSFVNPIIKDRLNRQTSNPINSGQQNQNIFNNNNNNQSGNIFNNNQNNNNSNNINRSSIFNNNNNNNSSIFNNNNNSSVFNNNNSSIFNNNNNNSTNGSIFNNNNNQSSTSNIFKNNNSIFNNNSSNQSTNIFNNNTQGTGIFANNNSTNIFNNQGNSSNIFNNAMNSNKPYVTIFDQMKGDNSSINYKNVNFRNRNVTNLTNFSQIQTYGSRAGLPIHKGKLLLPPPKQYQIKRINDQFFNIDSQNGSDQWVGAYLKFKDNGKVLKLDQEKLGEVVTALNMRNGSDPGFLYNNGLLEEVNGVKINSQSATKLSSQIASQNNIASALGKLDLNLTKAGVFINNPKRGRSASLSQSDKNQYFAKDEFHLNRHAPTERFRGQSDEKENEHSRYSSENEGQLEELINRQNQFYSDKPAHDSKQFIGNRFTAKNTSFQKDYKPSGILKKPSLGKNDTNFEADEFISKGIGGMKNNDQLNNNLLSMDEERKKNKQIEELFPQLTSQNRFWNELERQNFNKPDSITGKKKTKLISEIENDPHNDWFLPAREERLSSIVNMRTNQLIESKGQPPEDAFEGWDGTKSRVAFLNDKYGITKDNPLGLVPLDQWHKAILEDKEDEKEKEKQQKSKGFFGINFFSSLFHQKIEDSVQLDIECYITNISTQTSEGIPKQEKVKLDTRQTVQSYLENYFQNYCLKSELLWNRDFNQLQGKSAVYIDPKQKAMALTPLEKPLREFRLIKNNRIIIEFFTSDTPILTKANYKLTPSLEEISTWPLAEMQNINNLSIQNEHGCVAFENPVDITRQNLDDIVIIEQSRAYVYPEHLFSGKCPKLGLKLNTQAIVTLYNIDEKYKQQHLNGTLNYNLFEKNLKRQCEQMKCEFIELDRETFHFSFRVFDWTC